MHYQDVGTSLVFFNIHFAEKDKFMKKKSAQERDGFRSDIDRVRDMSVYNNLSTRQQLCEEYFCFLFSFYFFLIRTKGLSLMSSFILHVNMSLTHISIYTLKLPMSHVNQHQNALSMSRSFTCE